MLVRRASHTKDSIGCWANKRRHWCTKNDSQHNHVCIALSHDDSQNLLSLRCAHNLLLREIFLPTHCMIMHIPLVRAMHYAICTMPWFSQEHWWFPPQSYALWEICIMRICIMRYSTVPLVDCGHPHLHTLWHPFEELSRVGMGGYQLWQVEYDGDRGKSTSMHWKQCQCGCLGQALWTLRLNNIVTYYCFTQAKGLLKHAMTSAKARHHVPT